MNSKKLNCNICWFDGKIWQQKPYSVNLEDIDSITSCSEDISYNKNWFVLTTKQKSTIYITEDFQVVAE